MKKPEKSNNTTQDNISSIDQLELDPSNKEKIIKLSNESRKMKSKPAITPLDLLLQISKGQKDGKPNHKQRDTVVTEKFIISNSHHTRKRKQATINDGERSQADSSSTSEKKREVEDWNPDTPIAFVQYPDGIYNKVKIPKICVIILKTPTFHRLNNIKQLGVGDRIFRQSTHTRYEHSLGVANLARKMMKKWRRKRMDITGNDMLCVIIAGLCHDIGHGPFSHSLDPIMCEFNENFSHRRLSVQIFNYILDNEKDVKETLSKYLTDEDFEFIREIIHPPENFFDNDRKWILKGRPASKQHLYEIVSSSHHHINVDRFDCFIRDSHYTNMGITIGPQFISSFFDGIDVEEVDGEKRLAFDKKLADDFQNILSSSRSLCMKVYFHKNIYPLEYQLHKAIRLAAPHLKFRGVNRELKTVKEILTEPIDIEAYIKLDDHILFLIQDSEIDHPDIHEAKKCIERMEKQEVHSAILKVHFCNIEWNKCIEQEVEKGIQTISQSIPNLREQVIFKIRHHYRGRGPNGNPCCEVSDRPVSDNKEKSEESSHRSLKSETIIFVYGPHGMHISDADSFYRQMESYLKQHGVDGGLEFIFENSNQ